MSKQQTMDQRILAGEFPPEPPESERQSLGCSYYWDERAYERAYGRTHDQAVRSAARMMGQAVSSLHAVSR